LTVSAREEVLLDDLDLPEGPCFDAAGDFHVCEVAGGRVTRVPGGRPDAGHEVIATVPGANGAAFGPDGHQYVMSNGGVEWVAGEGHKLRPRSDNQGGRVVRVTAEGRVETVYDECDGVPLSGPNDVAFDPDGNFWFTDTRGRFGPRAGNVYFATVDGKTIRRVLEGVPSPNGIAVTEDGATLIIGESRPDQAGVVGPGRMSAASILGPGRLGPPSVYAVMPGNAHTDGMAFDAAGWLLVASQNTPQIAVFDDRGRYVESIRTEDPVTTNLAFGGDDMSTLYVTESSRGKGRVVLLPWKRPGIKMHAV
jgi:gluconolactonase